MSQSRKENEHRLPIHPQHFERIDPELRERIYVEQGYGEYFGVSDAELGNLVAGIKPRGELIEDCDVILLAKPQAEDLAEFRDGQILWGWPHCVQDERLTQLAIDRKLSLIAFEAMNHWTESGSLSLHVFHKNNELAGYSSVLHALSLAGTTGNYGRRLRAVVIGFGATARGAITALNAHGVHDVDVLTVRGISAVASPIPSARMVQVDHDDTNTRCSRVHTDDGLVPLPEFLAQHDIIVNCVLQDTDSPLTFLADEDLPMLASGTMIVDVSCDEAMGFSWAKPTTFDEPTFVVGNNVVYYAVDHSPSYLWNSATWEISEAVVPYLRTVLSGPSEWDRDETIRRAIEIRNGVIQNPSILSFQRRSAEYPHARTVSMSA
ncbi:N(5)-(carboxyethyl)ornithine synthase [Antrihabitans sp. YC2-6]|uniref:N(5)-(carboxyethyl)ornithine synthase n=1 Tax=Antrihabitans sp. YC2-6 TaxID=2799498 RepID=UPI001F30A3D8|nr:N(5)-(carboxyethyl)ornithine synthase [Antrihabitans sp. YC2-6]